MSLEKKNQFHELNTPKRCLRSGIRASLRYGAAVVGMIFFAWQISNAAPAEDILEQITNRTAEIAQLEEEIKAYRAELDKVGTEKLTLQSEIRRIDLTRKKLTADIKITEAKIAATTLNVKRLGSEIGGKEESIIKHRSAIGEMIRIANEADNISLAELALSSGTISDFWNDAERVRQFASNAEAQIRQLQSVKESLEVDKTDVEKERAALLSLQRKLSDQKAIADSEKTAKDKLLAQTKNKESSFRSVLAEKEALRKKFEQELLGLESELQVVVDLASIPTAERGILLWPVNPVRITQKFGDTAFARSGAYNGKGHNGIDLSASVGTEVRASISGVVVGEGNTDTIPGCYSYGKWILVRHNNGLSTLYAHLSLIKAKEGQTVAAGETIGYSGNTGYSTGPHLHFTVYATQGVEIVRLGDIKKITNCGSARIPVAPLNAYLNPLDYL